MRYGDDSCSCGCESPCGGNCSCQTQRGNPCRDAACGEDCGYPYRRPGVRSCDPCGEICRPMTCHDKTFCGPLTPIFALFTRDSWRGSGCGERYWGDFYGDPPDCSDPCDRCGNYTGGYGGWNGGGGSGRGCNCGGGGGSVGQPVMEQMAPTVPTQGKVIYRNDRVTGQIPTPAKSHKTTRQ